MAKTSEKSKKGVCSICGNEVDVVSGHDHKQKHVVKAAAPHKRWGKNKGHCEGTYAEAM